MMLGFARKKMQKSVNVKNVFSVVRLAASSKNRRKKRRTESLYVQAMNVLFAKMATMTEQTVHNLTKAGSRRAISKVLVWLDSRIYESLAGSADFVVSSEYNKYG